MVSYQAYDLYTRSVRVIDYRSYLGYPRSKFTRWHTCGHFCEQRLVLFFISLFPLCSELRVQMLLLTAVPPNNSVEHCTVLVASSDIPVIGRVFTADQGRPIIETKLSL
jgi:hypothetical protein